MPTSFRLVVVAPEGDVRSERIASTFGGSVVSADALGLARHVRGADIVHAFVSEGQLAAVVVAMLVAGRAGAVITPLDGPFRLPWWAWRFRRVLVSTQEEARAWAPEVSLGRLVVVDPIDASGAALGAVYAEVRAMGSRRRI